MAIKAKESPQVLKARRKLKKQMAEENKRITANALREMAKNIAHWLARHQKERIPLKDKTITLFDSNRHSARTQSKFINHLLQGLKQDKEQTEPKPLGGRITQSS